MKDSCSSNNIKIIFGTANLGLNNYGLISKGVRDDPFKILKKCVSLDIINIDTSPKYNNSEKIIGNFCVKENFDFKIHTKIPLPENKLDINEKNILKFFNLSMINTNAREFEVLYLHDNNVEFLSNPQIVKSMINLKKIGLIKKIGASIYTINEFLYCLNSSIYEVIQVPLNLTNIHIFKNILDKTSDKLIFARSIFLQGALANTNIRSENSLFCNEMLKFKKCLYHLLQKYNLSLPELCFKFIMATPNIDGIIIGTHNINNLIKIYKWSQQSIEKNLYDEVFHISEKLNFSYHDPRFW